MLDDVVYVESVDIERLDSLDISCAADNDVVGVGFRVNNDEGFLSRNFESRKDFNHLLRLRSVESEAVNNDELLGCNLGRESGFESESLCLLVHRDSVTARL